jgi:hypothetical protein
MPDAGKSSLLGALAQAADSQAHGLNAKLIDPTEGLQRLRHSLYDGTPSRTSNEVVPYPVVLGPFSATPAATAPGTVNALLIDCDGQVANEYLSRQRTLSGPDGESPLRDAILQADTLILAVDASNNAEILKRDFAQFARFLRLLEQSRAQRTDVGGLPVYLVLTKCDLLARKGDNRITWIERIEEHKRVVDRKFQEYLAQSAGREAHPFGKIDLHLWATAVKHPALENSPAQPREPYGVAELFRQCFQSAGSYRAHQTRAVRRLGWTVAALACLVGLLVLLGLFFYASRPGAEAGTLEADIRTFRANQGDTPAQRFAEPLDDKIKQLERFEADPAILQVSANDRQYVQERLQELKAYQQYRKELLDNGQDPRLIHTDAELNRLRDALERLPLPPRYAAAWRETKVGRLREQWQQDAATLGREVNLAEARLMKLVARWNKTQTDPLTASQRKAREKELLNEGDALPYREDNKDHFLPGSRSLTYENVLQFDRVAEVYRDWRAIRQEQRAPGGGQ